MAKIDKHHKKTRAVAVVALAIGVLGLGIAFAAMSTTLQIRGNATIASASWNVHWGNASCIAEGEAGFTTPIISTTSTTDDTLAISPTFKSNGDTVTCTFNAINDGTIDAKLGAVVSSLTNLTSNNITADLSYSPSGAPTIDDPLNASSLQSYQLVMTYTGQPVGTEINGITFTYQIPYIQKN
jgi:hypothetical protein